MPLSGRLTALLLTAFTVTTSQLGVAPAAQGAIPTYQHCDLYNSGSDHLTAYCTKKAAGTEYRVVIRCSNGKKYYGPWRNQGGTYSSTKYCPNGISIRGGWRQLR